MGSISVVYNQDISTLNVRDGVVIDVMTPPASGGLAPGAVAAVAYVGTASWGPFDSFQNPGDTLTALHMYGPQRVSANDLPTFLNLALQLGVKDCRTVRIGDGTQTAGVLPIAAVTGVLANLTGKYPGSLMNVATATLTYSPLTPLALQLGVKDCRTVRIGDGTQTAGVLPIAAVTGVLANLTGKYPGSLMNVATATLTYSPLTPLALQQVAGNSQKVLVDLTLTFPNLTDEVFQGLDGNVFVPGSPGTWRIDGTTLAAAIVAAVNNGLPNGHAKSMNFVASLAGGTNAPIMSVANVVTTLGTDGLGFTGIGASMTLDAAMLGSQSVYPYTGMYALDGSLSGAALALCGNTDIATIAGLMLAFAKAQNGHAVVAFPNGTPTSGSSGAISLKNALGLQDSGITVMAGDFVEIIDSVNGAIHRFVSPATVACARFAVTAPHISPANQSMNGLIVGTQRTGSQGNNPYDDQEVLDLENAGINFFTNDTSGNVGFALAHNKNSLGKSAGYRGNIAYSRMIQFLIASYKSTLLGQLVGQDQGFNAGDDVSRSSARALFNDFLGLLEDQNIIDGFRVVCDLTNNRPGRGMLRVDTTINLREIIDVVAVGLVAGVGIIASVTPLASSAATPSTLST